MIPLRCTEKGVASFVIFDVNPPCLALFKRDNRTFMEPSGYFPIIMQALVALGFVALVLIFVPMLGPRRKNAKKNENFECGIESQGNARMPVSIKYLMTAILFVLFDVEVIFFYPYAVNFRAMGFDGFFAVLMFVAVFLIGFYYVLRKGAFEWDK